MPLIPNPERDPSSAAIWVAKNPTKKHIAFLAQGTRNVGEWGEL
jgi:hypothetical protein